MRKLVVIFPILFIVLFAVAFFRLTFNDHTYIVKVTDKTVKNDADDSRYLIFCETEDGDSIVLENTDTIFRGKVNSSDVYAKINKDSTYELKVIGYRIPILSMYENIISIEKIDTEEATGDAVSTE